MLVTGANGQLGLSLQKKLREEEGITPFFTDVDSLDITDKKALEEFVVKNAIDYIVNCAAYTAVDKAESEKELAQKLNVSAVKNIAEIAAEYGIKTIHISTDYVFSGDAVIPYVEEEITSPHTIYGETKLQGEQELLSILPDAIIIRTAWLYSEYGKNFVKTMLRLADTGAEIRVVADQTGTPTYAGDLASAIVTVLKGSEWKGGIYHFSNEGVATWDEFAREIFSQSGNNKTRVISILTSEYPTPARRPKYSVLDKTKIKNTFNIEIPQWQDSLKKCLKEMPFIN